MQMPASVAGPTPAGRLLGRVFALLDREEVPYVVLHGYEGYPEQVNGDVDLLIAGQWLPQRVVELLHARRQELGAEVAQWVGDGAQFIVLAGRGHDGQLVTLQLHVSGDYVMDGRLFYRGSEILSSRRRRGTFWVPAAAVEFCCVVANRISKQNVRVEHERRLAELLAEDEAGCAAQLSRLLPEPSSRLVMRAAREEDWQSVRARLPELRRQLKARPAGGRISAIGRRVSRWLRPQSGLHVVFLGPDGVGKSTVIEQVTKDLRPLFLRSTYLTFAPGLLPSRFEVPKPDGPHSLPPRSLPASMVKAAWWSICYTAGYLASVHPTRARAGLVVNHRYLPDAIVDPKRYRYSGPLWVLRALWRVAPKPDLLFLLDAPAEVIQARKKEVTFEETVRQRDAYRAVVARLPFAHVVDASQPLAGVVGDVEQIIVRFLAGRCAARWGRT